VTAAGSVGTTGCRVATCAIPAFPGAQWTSVTWGSAVRDRQRACSRPPDPITRTRT
jgi:hypothetical protein